MSGFTNVTGFAAPTSVAGFMGLLQTASFRGVPFKVIAAQVKKGRRLAIHEYPFRDGGWGEDMGRALRTYSFSGYLTGDLAPVMQLLLDNAVETKGPGLLIHPTIGAVNVSLVSSSTAVHRDRMRVIEVAFEFVEQGGTVSPAQFIATAVAVLAAADTALAGAGTDLGGVAIPAAAIGPAVTGEGAAVVASFAAATTLGGANPTAIVGMAVALPPPDSNTTYGRYGAGSASVMLPAGTTVASLQAQLANQRAALALAAAGAATAAATYSASTDIIDALAGLVEAMRAGITNPAGQVQVLLALAGFSFTDGAGGLAGVGAAMAAMRDAMAAACRRAALVSLARASAAYQPVSYNDAAALRVSLAAALEAEITIAGDAGEDASYLALKALRAAVVQDLTVRGASLPSVVTVNLQLPLPSLAIAQLLYRDASRSDGIAAESGAAHPAFCPVTFQALASGMAASVNPVLPAPAPSEASGILVAKTQATAVYQLPPPGVPFGLTVASVTSSTAVLSWSAPSSGGLPASYLVQVSAHGADIWSTAGTVLAPATGYTVAGLPAGTEFDFQVLASNASGTGLASALATGTTLANVPNAATSVGAAAGSPAYSAAALTWTAPSADSSHGAATGYHLYQSLHPVVTWTYVADTAATAYTFAGLSHATAYDFLIVPFNTSGISVTNSGYTDFATDHAPPNAPAISAVAPVNDGTVTKLAVTWSASATDSTHDAATSYNLRYSVHAAASWTTVSGVTSGNVVTGLTSGTSYDVELQGANASTTSPGAWSGATTASTYSTVMSWDIQTTPVVHASLGNVFLAFTTPNPGGSVGVNYWYSTSATINTMAGTEATSRTSGGTDNGYPIFTNAWGAYTIGPPAAGTYYVWANVGDGSGGIISELVTVT